MYNGLISGVALDGMSFFYQNPLESDGKTKLYMDQVGRAPWFEVACCPPNITRFLPSVPGYIYAMRDDVLYVNLFIGNTAAVEVGGRKVALRQDTRYPWDGAVRIAVDPETPAEFTLDVRVPGWAAGRPVPSDLYRFVDANDEKPVLKVNGAAVALDMDKGYARVRRTWTKGDAVELTLPMPIRKVAAHPSVKEDAGRIALQRGPLVFCAEAVDNGGRVLDLGLAGGGRFTAEFRPGLLKGVIVLKGKAVVDAAAGGGPAKAERDFLAVPYYAWANRGAGEMRVWFPAK